MINRRPAIAIVLVLASALLVTSPAGAGFGVGLGFGRGGGWHNRSRFSVGFGYWPPYYSSYYYPPYYYPAYAPVYVAPGPTYTGVRGESGEIETKVKPSSATVYLDGSAVGTSGDFDGWPGRLSVSSGSHELLFREPGYRPLRIVVNVLPFHRVKVKDQMVRGADDTPDAAPASNSRTVIESTPMAVQGGGAPRHDRATPVLRLTVDPPDATVYVDGRQQGGGGGATTSYQLELAPGSHHVEVSKSGFDVFAGEVVLQGGQVQNLAVRLTPRGAQ